MPNRREANFSTVLRHWLVANPLYTCALEAKQTTTDSIPFSDVSQAQLDWGMAISSNKGILLRVQAVAEGMPDYIYMRNEPAFVVIRYPHFFVLILVEIFIKEKVMSERKSLTDKRARQIASVVVDL